MIIITITAGLLSLLFSFMVIWDLPRLAVGVKKLAHSRFGFAYQVCRQSVLSAPTAPLPFPFRPTTRGQASKSSHPLPFFLACILDLASLPPTYTQVLSPQITAFAKLVGQSFEVQSIIALVNTILTTLGLVALKIPGYGFLSLVVLITSFIPVFGVFLSTFPMALVALSEYGVRKMMNVILMVIGIHVVEVRWCALGCLPFVCLCRGRRPTGDRGRWLASAD